MSTQPVVCAWCEKLMEAGDSEQPISHGICTSCLIETSGRELVTLSAAEAEHVDELPFGLIQLDHEDRICIYNRGEAELTGCRPEDVLGRRFFAEVAPCTNVREFRGVLDELRAAGAPGLRRIRFAFQFAGEARDPVPVEIVMTYDPRDDVSTLLVKAI